jgi:TRAP-type C4-dicarboxylate transport system permease small subunit
MTTEPEVQPAKPADPLWVRTLVSIGGAALLGAMATDAAAVTGRHLGLPFLGAIEIVQAMVLTSGAVALVIATFLKMHACVHLLTERLPASVSGLLMRLGALFSAAFFASVLAGSFWIFADMRGAYEESEILHLAIWPMRVVIMICLAATIALCLQQTIKGTK